MWPGQVSSIRQHEHQVMLMTDVIHKFLRLDTVYTLLRRLHTTNPNNLVRERGLEVQGGRREMRERVMGESGEKEAGKIAEKEQKYGRRRDWLEGGEM